MESLYSLVKKYKTIIIHRHINPDGDALSSQMALKEIVKFNFPEKKVFAVGENYPKYLNQLFLPPDQIDDKEYDDALVIIVDTANKERISDSRWKKGKYILKIDHHVFAEKFGDTEIIKDDFSSCAEVILSLIYEEGKIKLNDKIAQLLTIGIITDTGRYYFNNTNKNSFYFTYKLMEEGSNLQNIYKDLYKKDDKLIKFSGYVMLKYKIIDNISYIILKKGIENKFNIDYSEVASMVSLITGGENVEYSLYATWNKEQKNYKISLRSKSKPINEIATKFNGGGHRNASGAKAKNKSEIWKMIGELKKL